MAVAATASAAASDTCRVAEGDLRGDAQSGHRWSDVFTGSLQFGQSVRAMAPPERGRGVVRGNDSGSYPENEQTFRKMTSEYKRIYRKGAKKLQRRRREE
jgi:hypothetical protein